MLNKTILIASSMGMVAFGFMAYIQAMVILTAQNNVLCFEDVGYTDIWVIEIALLVLASVASSLCLSLVIMTGARD